jgi:hypothetical protein
LHWPNPPSPIEYPPTWLGLVVAMAIALILIGVVLYAAKFSGTLQREREQEADETRREEKERNKMTE